MRRSICRGRPGWWPASCASCSRVRGPAPPITWLALAWLGLLGSCTAYLLYFYLIETWGPTRATLVTYVFPVVGVLLGVVFLNEVADWRLVLGSALVVGGIGLVNVRVRRRATVASAAVD